MINIGNEKRNKKEIKDLRRKSLEIAIKERFITKEEVKKAKFICDNCKNVEYCIYAFDFYNYTEFDSNHDCLNSK
jgi:hypothetical protein